MLKMQLDQSLYVVRHVFGVHRVDYTSEHGPWHRLAEAVERAPARETATLPEAYACFASACFPRLVREVRQAQRRRGALASIETCLVMLGGAAQ